MKPILIRLGPFPISSFGLFLLGAFLVGIAVVRRRGKEIGIDPSRMLDAALYMIIGGIVAGRIGYVLANLSAFARAPQTMVTIWRDSGLTFYGALAGAVLVGAFYARRLQVPLRAFLDLFAPALALGYAVAMIGALLHGLYLGRPTGVPWAVQMFLERRHPTPIYLLLASLGSYAVLRAQERRGPPAGMLFVLWVLLLAVSRFAVEFFVESPTVGSSGLTLAQAVNALVAVLAVATLVVLARVVPAQPAAAAGPPEMPPAS
ncbi:MAG: prolipoprotein diacylglyceryl transferase [Armatimonadota bacterium]|nr:prolipoprotein diacylglyceryl transferase [Armatimonadota bacterium]MDR7451782.1 prolipoprotein diacylglyceryl transferase [Armatimonadota bacterium]MDR7467407.1 prolipoprotein diacylglyceryl transferase [Armatimonadota bacterium]MDR7494177.1 prolipoprotein diacylglyceryl transferase [Armatimonadota bacterium]MDR7498857.1 prolipoprotein diacylglyceryl transferase [Armatimonadota bacterium]